MGSQTHQKGNTTPCGVFQALAMLEIAVLIFGAIAAFAAWYRMPPSQSAPQVAWTGEINGVKVVAPGGAIFIEHTDLLYDGRSQGWGITSAHQDIPTSVRPAESFETCWANETYISVYQGQESLCYDYVPLPAISLLATLPFKLDGATALAAMGRPANVLFIESTARRAPGDGQFFSDGTAVFYMIWVAGDCTPRIVDGRGGYWQMPVAPAWQALWAVDGNQHGPGYLIHLPQGWQTSWEKPFSEATPWRLCATAQFGGQ